VASTAAGHGRAAMSVGCDGPNENWLVGSWGGARGLAWRGGGSQPGDRSAWFSELNIVRPGVEDHTAARARVCLPRPPPRPPGTLRASDRVHHMERSRSGGGSQPGARSLVQQIVPGVEKTTLRGARARVRLRRPPPRPPVTLHTGDRVHHMERSERLRARQRGGREGSGPQDLHRLVDES